MPIALTFDDFLDHGAEYLKHGRMNEARVIAGIVFEDTIRHICRVLRSTRRASPWISSSPNSRAKMCQPNFANSSTSEHLATYSEFA